MEKKNMNEVSKKKKKFAKIHTRKEIMKKQTRKKMNDCEISLKDKQKPV
jgi:hypothetical protein